MDDGVKSKVAATVLLLLLCIFDALNVFSNMDSVPFALLVPLAGLLTKRELDVERDGEMGATLPEAALGTRLRKLKIVLPALGLLLLLLLMPLLLPSGPVYFEKSKRLFAKTWYCWMLDWSAASSW